jgi:hypothetical protein
VKVKVRVRLMLGLELGLSIPSLLERALIRLPATSKTLN